MKDRLPVVLMSLVAVMALTSVAAAADAARKPNVIFILADDLGWTDVGCYGSTYNETPNIDKLASQGMRFTSAYTAAPNCAPTRAALLSGQYGPRTGIYTVGGINRFDWSSRPLRPVDNVQKLPLDKVTLPQAMKDAGYATAMFGKWHLGNPAEFHPSQRGFDEAIVSNGRHVNFVTDPAMDIPKDAYLADFLTDKAVDFIQRKKDGPFFLYLPHFGVHGPYQAKPELIKKFEAKKPAGNHHDPVYAAMLYSVDESVGRIMAKLDELKLADDTLVIFSSDNGGVGGYAREGIAKKNKAEVTDNAPLRSGKGSLYEGGTRVPFVARFPGKIKPGSTTEQPIISVDLYPTFLELAHAKPKDGYTLDGVSILPVLTGTAPSLSRDAIYWHFPGYLGIGGDNWRTTPAGAIRSGDYKLLEFFETGKVELYNLKDDLSQKNDLSAKDPAKTKELHDKLVAWRQSVNAPMPQKMTPDEAAKNKKQQGKGKRNAEDE